MAGLRRGKTPPIGYRPRPFAPPRYTQQSRRILCGVECLFSACPLAEARGPVKKRQYRDATRCLSGPGQGAGLCSLALLPPCLEQGPEQGPRQPLANRTMAEARPQSTCGYRLHSSPMWHLRSRLLSGQDRFTDCVMISQDKLALALASLSLLKMRGSTRALSHALVDRMAEPRG